MIDWEDKYHELIENVNSIESVMIPINLHIR